MLVLARLLALVLILQDHAAKVSSFQIFSKGSFTRKISEWEYRECIGSRRPCLPEVRSPTVLNLFSLNQNQGNDGGPREKEEKMSSSKRRGIIESVEDESGAAENDTGNDGDLSSWVEGIAQWPLYPYSSSSGKSPQNELSDRLEKNEEPLSGSGAGEEGPTSSRYRDGSNSIFNLWNVDALLEAVVSGSISEIDSDQTSPISPSPAKPSGTDASATNDKKGVDFSDIMSATKDQLFGRLSARVARDPEIEEKVTSSIINVTTVEEFAAWDDWTEAISRSISDAVGGSEGIDADLGASMPIEKSEKSAAVDSKINEAVLKSEDRLATSPAGLSKAAETVLKDATFRIGTLMSGATTALSPASVQELINRASRAFTSQSKDATQGIESIASEVVEAAESTARDQGLDVREATERARGTMKFATEIMGMASTMFAAGYAPSMTDVLEKSVTESSGGMTVKTPQVENLVDPGKDGAQDSPKPLFHEFKTAREIVPQQYASVIAKGAEMGCLAGAIYFADTPSQCWDLKHSLVSNGTTADVAWMVSDSIDDEENFREADLDDTDSSRQSKPKSNSPVMVRTITIRGFDASDESVDRERILNTICSPRGVEMDEKYKVMFHSGLLGTARSIYADVKKYIEWTSPDHKIVLNGHSIGGSLSVLLLLLMVEDRGVEFVRRKVLRVFTHGSPPIAAMAPKDDTGGGAFSPVGKFLSRNGQLPRQRIIDNYECDVLKEFGLPSSMVYGFVQPWDPIVRFLTKYDPLYPLVDDIGEDGFTLYSKGPSRSLRPITRAIFKSWEGWPKFRSNWMTTKQQYQSIGIQHILLPEPLRYLNDRFVSASVGLPPIDVIVRISSRELLPALDKTFPMDVFQISYVPQAIRSFVHHFFPAYESTIANYAAKVAKQEVRRKKMIVQEDSKKRTEKIAGGLVANRLEEEKKGELPRPRGVPVIPLGKGKQATG